MTDYISFIEVFSLATFIGVMAGIFLGAYGRFFSS